MQLSFILMKVRENYYWAKLSCGLFHETFVQALCHLSRLVFLHVIDFKLLYANVACFLSIYLLLPLYFHYFHSLMWLIASQILISLLFNCISLFSPISSFTLLFVANFYMFSFSIHSHWSFAITSLMLGNFFEFSKKKSLITSLIILCYHSHIVFTFGS